MCWGSHLSGGGEFLLSVIVQPGGGAARPFSYSVGVSILSWGKVAGL